VKGAPHQCILLSNFRNFAISSADREETIMIVGEDLNTEVGSTA
jgi:hypothetical protein